ncbi:MAG: CBS domain-containing protein [Candidatus Margulisiibacteriota bacterium]|jgi:CBS domain-containing protein
MFVKDIMFKNITSVEEDAELKYLIKILVRQRRDTLPVVSKDNEYIGLIGVQDILNASVPGFCKVCSMVFMPNSKMLMKGLKKVSDKKVKSFLKKIPTVTEKDTAIHAANLMIRKGLQTVAVLKGKKLVGMVNLVDFLASLLNDYTITGNY